MSMSKTAFSQALQELGQVNPDAFTSEEKKVLVNADQEMSREHDIAQESESLSPLEAKSILNDARQMALLAQNSQALPRLQSLLGLKAYCYLAGFRTYFPKDSRSAWREPPMVKTSYPLQWRLRYWLNGWALIDPAVTRTTAEQYPMLWRTGEFEANARDLAQAAEREGVFSGVTWPLYMPTSEVALLTLVPGGDSVLSSEELYDYRFGIGMFLAEYHRHAFREVSERIRNKVNLTLRERDVLKRIVLGKKNVDIARELGVTESAIKRHQENLLRKFNVRGRTDLLPAAISLGYTALVSRLDFNDR